MTREILTKGLNLAKKEHIDLSLVDPEDIARMNTLEELMAYLYEMDMFAVDVYEYEMDNPY